MPGFERWLLLCGVAMVLVAIAFAHLASGTEETSKQHDRVAYMRLITAAVALLLGLFTNLSAQGLTLAVAVLLIATATSNVKVQTD